MRHRTGNRNRYRSRGSGSYSREHKARSADSYGTWTNGRQDRPDTIAGHTVLWRMTARP